jgi:hypothetical protein
MHGGATAQMTLALGAFLGKYVAHIGRSAFNSALGLLSETLGRAAFGLEFRHDYLFFNIAPGVRDSVSQNF